MEDKSVEIILFEAIQTALASLLAANTIRSVEIWNSQDDNEQRERPRNYPFVAVQIDTDWMPEEGAYFEYDQNQQKGDCIVTIHYIYEQIATETNQWLTQRAIVHQVHRALNGLSADGITPFVRNGTPHEESHDRVSDIRILYSTMLTECAYQDDSNKIEAGDWNLQFNNKLAIDNVIVRTGKISSIGRVFHVDDFPPEGYIPQENDVIVE